MAFEALGYSADLDNELVREFHDDALLIRGLFHLATADIGHYNLTHDGYLQWVMSYIEMWFEPAGQADSSLIRLSRHVNQQVYITLVEPRSEIGVAFRGLESAAESIAIGSSTVMYWDYLIGPLTLLWTPLDANVIEATYERLAPRYIRSHLSDPSNKPDFAAFLVDDGFASAFAPSIARNDPTAIATRTPLSSDTEIPRRGTILYDSPLSDWQAADYETGWVQPSSISLLIGVYSDGGEHIIEEWTDRSDFADVSASVELREVSNRANAAGCISIRHDVASGDYSLCILGDGKSWAAYHYVDSGGNWQVETILWPEVRSVIKHASNWNTLEIVAKGNQLWFAANGTVLGSVTHNARSVGAVAVSVTNWDGDLEAEFEFRNLVVREIR